MSLFGNKGYEVSDVKVYRTKNYDIFNDITGNRIVDQTHLSNLEQSVKERNWLANEPGMVNDKGQLIDGQHRLRVARARNTYFYFTVGDGANEKDVILLNTNSKNWAVGEWLGYYIANGYEDYIELEKFARKHEIAIGNAAALLSLNPRSYRVTMSRKAFRSGNFQIKDVELAEELIEWVKKFEKFCSSPKIAVRRDFIQAVWRMMRNEEINIEDVYEKLIFGGQKLFLVTSDVEYLRQFEDIYNLKTAERNRVRLY